MAESFPDVQKVRERIHEAERLGFEKDRQCLASLRQKIITHMNDRPDNAMTIVFERKDVVDKPQCERVMERICRELRQKGFHSNWTVDVSTDHRGDENWYGPTLEITVPKVTATSRGY